MRASSSLCSLTYVCHRFEAVHGLRFCAGGLHSCGMWSQLTLHRTHPASRPCWYTELLHTHTFTFTKVFISYAHLKILRICGDIYLCVTFLYNVHIKHWHIAKQYKWYINPKTPNNIKLCLPAGLTGGYRSLKRLLGFLFYCYSLFIHFSFVYFVLVLLCLLCLSFSLHVFLFKVFFFIFSTCLLLLGFNVSKIVLFPPVHFLFLCVFLVFIFFFLSPFSCFLHHTL